MFLCENKNNHDQLCKLIKFIRKNKPKLFNNKLTRFKNSNQILYNFRIIEVILTHNRFSFFKFIYKNLQYQKYYIEGPNRNTINEKYIRLILNKINLPINNKNNKNNKISLLLYLCYIGNLDAFLYIVNEIPEIISTYTTFEIKQCFYLCCHVNKFTMAQILYINYKPKLTNYERKTLFLILFKNNHLKMFTWLEKTYDFNLFTIKQKTNFYSKKQNKQNKEKKQKKQKKIDLFWIACKENKINFCKVIFINYQKYIKEAETEENNDEENEDEEKEENNPQKINIFLNLQHQHYYSKLLCHSNKLYNNILKWLFLISNFNLNYRGYLIDLIEYLCELNNYELLKWLYNEVITIYNKDDTVEPFYINDSILSYCVKQNFIKVVDFLVTKHLLKSTHNYNYLLTLQKCAYYACKHNLIKIIHILDKKHKMLLECNDNYLSNISSDDNNVTNINKKNIFSITHTQLYKITLSFIRLYETSTKKSVYENLITIYKILYENNQKIIFIEKEDRIFKILCEYDVLNVLNWLLSKFKFYNIYRTIINDLDPMVELKTIIIPMIDYKNLDYLLINDKWLELSEKYNMKIIIRQEISTCNICFEQKNNCISKCEHQFCFCCIYQWLEKNNDCPYCRSTINGMEELQMFL